MIGPYAMGKEDYLTFNGKGEPDTICPFSNDSEEGWLYSLWLQGWYDAEQDRYLDQCSDRECSGKMYSDREDPGSRSF